MNSELKQNSAEADLDQKPSVSIVMPSYNRSERLKRALTHIALQNYPACLIEVVIVLDGCTDGSAKMVEGMKPSYPLALKVLEKPQGGPASARNAGVLAATGEYILFLDDDVMATPRLLLEHWSKHRTDPFAVVIGPMSTPSNHHRPVWVKWEEFILEGQYKDILAGKYRMTPRQFYTGNCSLKRQYVLDAGLFDEQFKRYEDVELAYRLKDLGVNFYFNPLAIGYHFASRTFQSWTKAHYLYGRYAVKLDRDKNLAGMIKMSLEEFETRHWLTRFLSRLLLNRNFFQTLFIQFFLIISQLANLLKLERRGFQALSCIANMLYWQGFNDELSNAGTPDSALVKAGAGV